MIYFDNAATSYKKPPSVIRELLEAVKKYGGNPGRSSHRLSLAAAERIYEARVAIAELLGFPLPENLVFTLNATHALNLAIKSFAKEGMHILIGSREHNAVLRPVHALHAKGVAGYSVFPSFLPPEKSLLPLLTEKTGLVVLNHTSNVDGETSDIATYGAFCKQHGLRLIIDASQSIGHRKFNYSDCEADAVCAPLHKGLFGIQGGGFAYFASEEDCRPLIEGGSGSSSFLPEMPLVLPDRLEAGTLPTPAILTAGEGARFIKKIGVDEIEAKEKSLFLFASEVLGSFSGTTLYLPKDKRGGVLSFSHKDYRSEDLARRFSEKNVCVRGGFHCAPLAHKALGTEEDGTIRLSFNYFNEKHEIERFYKICKTLFNKN